MDGINGSTSASGTVDCIMPPPATNVPQGSPDLAVGIVVDVGASPSQQKEQSVNSIKSHARNMGKKKKCGRVSKVLKEQLIVGIGAVNLTPKAEDKEQEASKALQHDQVKAEDESPHKPEAVIMLKTGITDTDNVTSSQHAAGKGLKLWLNQHAAGKGLKLWPNQIHVNCIKGTLTDAEMKKRLRTVYKQFPKLESARKNKLKARHEALLKVMASRQKN